jgi:hypothetical protein
MEKLVKFFHVVMYTALELSSSSCLQEQAAHNSGIGADGRRAAAVVHATGAGAPLNHGSADRVC